ncbi:hypothetical protein scyTo_0024239 [Scyliorhinus torazame]|uniref:Uncharacterized protein n=1 Tax=Scyliorhinus torazame TaxID=75743 RepID=A0A401QEB3_SCYTO|nr:hypothetical protein [Scyliorhinus torazame]
MPSLIKSEYNEKQKLRFLVYNVSQNYFLKYNTLLSFFSLSFPHVQQLTRQIPTLKWINPPNTGIQVCQT